MSLVIIKFVCFLFLTVQGSSVDVETRVVNGIEVETFIPYQASVRVSMRDHARFGGGHTCGGVVISRRTVTTAAHCLFDGPRRRNAFDLRVVLGSINRFHYTRETVIRPVEEIIIYPGYRRGESFAHDIGLLILRSPVEFTNIVHSIEIIDHEVEPFTECQISGWGATEWRGFMPSVLRMGIVSMVPRTSCNASESYGKTFVDGMVCANGINDDGLVDVCQGDSGGPLTCNNKLVGLASFGLQCGFSLDHPGVFADVFYYKDWIEENSVATQPTLFSYLAYFLCMTIVYLLS